MSTWSCWTQDVEEPDEDCSPGSADSVGTLRSAVDPLEQYTDEDITQVLVRVGLLKEKPLLTTGYGTFDSPTSTAAAPTAEGNSTSSSTLLSRSSPGEESNDDSGTLSSLETRIEESGGNLSSGQKQLLSLSRILLSASSPANANSVVVLDESTSSIDYTTDAKIQSLLDSHFAKHKHDGAGHRTSTAHHYRLRHGRRAQSRQGGGEGQPVELLRREDGWFTRLAKSTGEEEYASLKGLIGL